MRFSIFALLLVSSVAAANTRQGPTFKTDTTYQHCQNITMFACGMTDSSGRRYGTAHERKECTRYTFHRDGTFTQRGDFELEEHGTYRIFAGKVRITHDDRRTFELALSPDGTKLGDYTLTRPARAPE